MREGSSKSNRQAKSAFFFLFLLTLLFLFNHSAYALNACVWISDVSGNYSNAANWTSCGGVAPTSADTVTFNSTHVGDCSIDASSSTNTISLTISSGYTGTITQNRSYVITNTFSQAAGTYTNPSSSLSMAGFTLTGGTFNAPASPGSISNTGTHSQSTGTFNASSGTITISNNFTISSGAFNGSSGTLNLNGTNFNLNGGTFTAPSGTLNFNGSFFLPNNGGTFTHNSGTVAFTGNAVDQYINYNGASGNTPATVNFNNFTLNQASNTNSLFIYASNTVNVAGLLSLTRGQYGSAFSGAVLDAQGTLSVASTFTGANSLGSLRISGAAIGTVTLASGVRMPSTTLFSGTNATLNTSAGSGQTVTFLDLTIQTGGTVDFSGTAANLTISSTGITQSGGTFTMGSGTLDITGTVTISGGVFTASSGTTNFSGGFTHTAGGTFTNNGGTAVFRGNSATVNVNVTETFTNLNVNKNTGQTLTISSGDTLIVTGTLTLTDGAISTGTIDARGPVSIPGGATLLDGGSGTVQLSTSVVRTVTIPAGTSFPALSTSSTATLTTITPSGSGTITFASYSQSAGIGSFGASSINVTSTSNFTLSGTASFTGGTGTYNMNANFTLSGTASFTAGAGTYNMNGSFFNIASGTTFTNPASPGSMTLASTLNSSGTFNGSSGNISITAGGLDIEAGTFTSTSGTLSIIGNYTRSTTGSFVHNNGTVIFTGASDTSVTGTSGYACNTFNNLTINKSSSANGFTIPTALTCTVIGTMRFQQGFCGTILNGIIDAQGPVTVDSTFTGGGICRLQLTTTTGRTVTIPTGASLPQVSIMSTATGTSIVPSGSGGTIGMNALTIAASGSSVNFGGSDVSLNVTNSFTQSNGTFTTGTGTYTIASGNFTLSGGTFTATTGTVAFAGIAGANATIDVVSSQTFNNLTFNKNTATATIASGDTLIVTGTLTFTRGSVDASGGGGLQARGDVTVGSTFTGGTAPLTFTGSTLTQTFDLTGATGNFNADITVNKSSGTVALNSALVMDASNQDLAITSGIFSIAGNNLTVNGTSGTFSVASTGTFQLQGGETITLNGGNPTLSAGSTVLYNGTVGPYTLQNYSYSNLTIAGGAATLFSLPGALTGIATTTLTTGILSLAGNNISMTTLSNNSTFRLQGGETVTITNGMDTDSGTVEYVGNGATSYASLAAGNNYYALTFNNAAGSWTHTSTLDINNNLTITAGTLVSGGQNITIAGNWSNAGTYTSGSNTVTFDGSGAQTLTTGGTGTGQDFNNLTVNKSNTLSLVTNNLDVDGTLTVSGGTFSPGALTTTAGTLTVDGGIFTGAAGTIDVNGALTVSSGTFTSSSGTMTLSGNFTHSGGTFTHNSGTVTLDGANQAVIGSTTFNNFTKNVTTAQTLTLPASTTNTFVGTLTLTGTAGNLLTLASSSTGTQTQIDPQGARTAQYLNVSNNNNINPTVISCASCTNSGNNTNWSFSSLVRVWDGGGVDNNWSTAANWSGDAVPVSTDVARFNGTSTKDATIDVPIDVAGITITTGYTGTITQGAASTVAIGDQSFTQSTGTFTGVSESITITSGSFSLSGGIFTSTSGTLSLTGDFNHTAGTFTANSGTVLLNGTGQTISGSTTFNNLTKNVTAADTLTLPAGATNIIAGTLTLTGTSGNLLSLVSSSPGTQTSINPQGTRSVQYLSVQDNNNVNATAISCTTGCTNAGNNTNWDFAGSVTANAGPDRTIVTTTSTKISSINLDGSGSVGTSLTYSWVITSTTGSGGVSQAGTLTNADTATPLYTAPTSAQRVTITLTVTSSGGSSPPSSDTVVMTVLDPNNVSQQISPTVVAGIMNGITIVQNSSPSGALYLTLGNLNIILPTQNSGYSFALSSTNQIILGFPEYNNGAGEACISTTSVTTMSGFIDLNQSNPSNFVCIPGAQSGGALGQYVNTGDFNADGAIEFMISAPGEGTYGTMYLYSSPTNVEATIIGTQDYPIASILSGNYIAIPAQSISFGPNNPSMNLNLAFNTQITTQTKQAYFLANPAGITGTILLSVATINGAAGDIIIPPPFPESAPESQAAPNSIGVLYNSQALGDVNGDGLTDLILVSDDTIYIFFGQQTVGTTIDIADADVVITGGSAADGFGQMVITGDVTGDGINDVIVGAPYGNNNQGIIYVIFGSTEWEATMDLNTNAQVLPIYGNTPGGQIGSDLLIGDANQDGVSDIYTVLSDHQVLIISLFSPQASGGGCQMNPKNDSIHSLFIYYCFFFFVSFTLLSRSFRKKQKMR